MGREIGSTAQGPASLVALIAPHCQESPFLASTSRGTGIQSCHWDLAGDFRDIA